MVSFFHHGDPKAELIPPTDARMLGFFLTLLYTSGNPGDRDHFLTPDLKHANITLYLRDHKGETLRRVIERARAFLPATLCRPRAFAWQPGTVGCSPR